MSNESWKQYVEVWTHICASVNTLFLEECSAISPKAIQILSLPSIFFWIKSGPALEVGCWRQCISCFIFYTSHLSVTPWYFQYPTGIEQGFSAFQNNPLSFVLFTFLSWFFLCLSFLNCFVLNRMQNQGELFVGLKLLYSLRMVSLSKYFIIFARQSVSEEDIHNTEWQNTHDLAAVALSWKVGNVAQHSKEKISLRHPGKCNRDPREIFISA